MCTVKSCSFLLDLVSSNSVSQLLFAPLLYFHANDLTLYSLTFSSLSTLFNSSIALLLLLSLCPQFWSGPFLFLFYRTGLEAIMETYAFWRPPVRTLTFEDFTNMQKQQGVWIEHQSNFKGSRHCRPVHVPKKSLCKKKNHKIQLPLSWILVTVIFFF